MDLHNAASFFRDPRAVVTNWLLPLKVIVVPMFYQLNRSGQLQAPS
jgi:hypothetical protein